MDPLSGRLEITATEKDLRRILETPPPCTEAQYAWLHLRQGEYEEAEDAFRSHVRNLFGDDGLKRVMDFRKRFGKDNPTEKYRGLRYLATKKPHIASPWQDIFTRMLQLEDTRIDLDERTWHTYYFHDVQEVPVCLRTVKYHSQYSRKSYFRSWIFLERGRFASKKRGLEPFLDMSVTMQPLLPPQILERVGAYLQASSHAVKQKRGALRLDGQADLTFYLGNPRFVYESDLADLDEDILAAGLKRVADSFNACALELRALEMTSGFYSSP